MEGVELVTMESFDTIANTSCNNSWNALIREKEEESMVPPKSINFLYYF